jgi:hypothetical protein
MTRDEFEIELAALRNERMADSGIMALAMERGTLDRVWPGIKARIDSRAGKYKALADAADGFAAEIERELLGRGAR